MRRWRGGRKRLRISLAGMAILIALAAVVAAWLRPTAKSQAIEIAQATLDQQCSGGKPWKLKSISRPIPPPSDRIYLKSEWLVEFQSDSLPYRKGFVAIDLGKVVGVGVLDPRGANVKRVRNKNGEPRY